MAEGGGYLAVGLLKKQLRAIYTGRSGHLASRLMGHLGELEATCAGFASGTLLHDVLVDCERVMWFKLWEPPSDLDAEEAGDIAAILEDVFTMLFGSFDRDEDYLKLRLTYGLENLGSDVVGCNGELLVSRYQSSALTNSSHRPTQPHPASRTPPKPASRRS